MDQNYLRATIFFLITVRCGAGMGSTSSPSSSWTDGIMAATTEEEAEAEERNAGSSSISSSSSALAPPAALAEDTGAVSRPLKAKSPIFSGSL